MGRGGKHDWWLLFCSIWTAHMDPYEWFALVCMSMRQLGSPCFGMCLISSEDTNLTCELWVEPWLVTNTLSCLLFISLFSKCSNRFVLFCCVDCLLWFRCFWLLVFSYVAIPCEELDAMDCSKAPYRYVYLTMTIELYSPTIVREFNDSRPHHLYTPMHQWYLDCCRSKRILREATVMIV